MLAKMTADIEKYGWTDISVFPTEDDPGISFSYSVGMLTHDHPDMIVVGMSSQVAHGVLWSAYEAIQAGTRLFPDTYCDQVLEGLPVAIVEVSDPLGDLAPMTMCNNLYGEVEGVQIVWPDANSRFPWHEDFDERFRAQQPLLGAWKGEL